MTTVTKTLQKLPRFVVRVTNGRLSYACRGCQHQCHHPEPMMKHLQACNAF
jgi:hypothetical protein